MIYGCKIGGFQKGVGAENYSKPPNVICNLAELRNINSKKQLTMTCEKIFAVCDDNGK